MEYRFLWVELQLKAICAQVSDYGIEETLQNIPMDIHATYERILDTIDKKPPAQRELARKVLLFVAYAREPISIDTLALAIAVKDHTQDLNILRSSVSTQKIILHACGNLLSVDQHVHFIHFSVHEFLTSDRSRLLHNLSLEYEVAHREIARMCMSFLLILFSQLHDYCEDVESLFAQYIFSALPHHLLDGNLYSLSSNDEIINLTLLFFRNSPPLLASCDNSPPLLASCDNSPPLLASYYIRKDDYFKDLTFLTFSPSVLALIFNLPVTYQYDNLRIFENKLDERILAWIYSYGDDDIDSFIRVFDDNFAMHYAIGQLNSVTAASRLYTHGNPIDYSYCGSDRPLYAYDQWAHECVPDICCFTPLYLVKSEEVARFLLDRGASVNPTEIYKLPNLLGHITKGGNTKVIQLLLDSGAQQDQEAQNNALQSLAYDGKVEVISFLVDKGADVNAQGGEHGNALQAAAVNGKFEAIQLLLDKGADVNAQGGFYGNALQTAVIYGGIEATQLLLDKGADVNVQGGELGNALQAAARSYNTKAVQLLLDKGAGVNVQGGMYGNALQAAARKGNTETIQLLLDEEADVNAQGGVFGNALQGAAYKGNTKTIQLLLDKGAYVNAQGGAYGNALQGAAYEGNTEAIQLLLDKGADVNAQGGKYGNALQAAAFNGKFEAIQLLLDKGADVNAQGGELGNALQAAARNGNTEIVQLLVDKGADVNAQGGRFGNALQAAAFRGHTEAIQLLLDKGADVNLKGGLYGSALRAAEYGGNAKAVQLLRDMGVVVGVYAQVHGLET